MISPHNAAFYKLLDELWSEAEDLMDRGISGSGQGFDAPSAGRLGSHAFIPIHNPPSDKMADAIRKVRLLQRGFGSGAGMPSPPPAVLHPACASLGRAHGGCAQCDVEAVVVSRLLTLALAVNLLLC
jgi:hypothetical protein